MKDRKYTMFIKDKVKNNTLRPMYYEEKPQHEIHAATGTTLRCKTWEAEAALRMLENNIDPNVALMSDELIVYEIIRECKNKGCYVYDIKKKTSF